MRHPGLLLLVLVLLALLPLCAAADEPEMHRAGVWYRSLAETDPVRAGEGYFSLRMVQAQLVSSRPGWLTSLLTGAQGAKHVFVSMQFAYGDTSFQAPVAWGEVRPDRPRLPQTRLQCSPWLPVVTKAGAPVQPKLAVVVRTATLTGGGILSALHLLAERAAEAGPLASFASSASTFFTYQDVFEQVFGAFSPRQTTPTAVAFDLALSHQAEGIRFSKYLLITDAGSRLERRRQGRVETFPWEEWEQRLKIPGEGSVSPYLTWADTGEPVSEVSFVLFEVQTLPRFFSDYESLHSAAELYKTIYKLVLMPLTTALRGLEDEQEIADVLRAHLDQLREWLWTEQPGISMKDCETICRVVGEKALQDAGLAPRFTVKTWPSQEGLPGSRYPESVDPGTRPGLHAVPGWRAERRTD